MPDARPDEERAGPAFTTRPVRRGDEAFLRRLYASTRAAELALVDWPEERKQKFVRQQYDAQRGHYEQHFPAADHEILLVAAEPVGRTWVDRRPDEIRILDMAVLPEHRGAGIGTAVVRRHQGEATERAVPLTLCVELNNPRARRLYLRLGFTVIRDYQTHELLEWVPPSGAGRA